MKLHVLGLPHTVTRDDFSHCAYTGKVKRFAPMMRAQGFEVIHYGNEGSDAGANEDVVILTRDEHLELLDRVDYHDDPAQFIGHQMKCGPLFDRFNAALHEQLERRLAPGDMVCLPLGDAHHDGTRNLRLVRSRQALRVETGIGYPYPVTLNRVYESEAWRHYTMGHEQRSGAGWNSPRFECVIPNYFQISDWPLSVIPERGTVLYFGRITETKGCGIIPVLARAHPSLRFIMCGQGDPSPYLTAANIEYRPPVSGRARAELLGSAVVAIFPSRFLEPFCGAAVEAMLCGTPVLTSDFGAFTETNIEGVTGYRCRTERDWFDALNVIGNLDRAAVSVSARERFSTEKIGPQYAWMFNQLSDALAAGRPAGATT